MMASRFSIPIPKGTVASIDKYATDYKGVVAAMKIDPKTGQISMGWEILMPPFDYDLGDAGKKMSDGWMFWTCYNAERATGKLEETASQRDRDYIAAVDWKAAEKAIAEGKGDMIGGVKVLDPKKVPGIVYLMPCGKSPHGVDVAPDGKWIVGSGKLQGVTTVVQLREDPDGDPQQGLHRRRGRDPGAEVRVDQGSRGAGRPRAAPHAVCAGRLRLHVAVRGQRDRQVEARHVGGGGQDPDVLLDRPPHGGRGRHGHRRTAST